MVRAVIERRNDKGEWQYARGLEKVSDTSLAQAVIRNGVIFNAQALMILSAPATSLAKSLDVQGTKEIYRDRVRVLVVVDSGSRQDVHAMRKVLAEFPAPIVYCGKDVGNALRYPGSSVEKDFGWAEVHPVVDAYRAYQTMPYDAPSYDIAGALYAVRADRSGFSLSETGRLSVDDDGVLRFLAEGAGNARALTIDAGQQDRIIQTYIELASARPIAPQRRQPPPV
jgi:hypothetical protein